MRLCEDEEIIFRQINDNLPRYWQPGENWFVEYHAGGTSFPLGMAVVHINPPDHDYPDPTMSYLFVSDAFRRRGIATRLIEACQER